MSIQCWSWEWRLTAFKGLSVASSRTLTFATRTGLLWMVMLSIPDPGNTTELMLVPGLCGTLMLLVMMPKDGGLARRQRKVPMMQSFLKGSKRFSRKSNSSRLRKLRRKDGLTSLRPEKLLIRNDLMSSHPEKPASSSPTLMQVIMRSPYSRRRTTTSISSFVQALLNARWRRSGKDPSPLAPRSNYGIWKSRKHD